MANLNACVYISYQELRPVTPSDAIEVRDCGCVTKYGVKRGVAGPLGVWHVEKQPSLEMIVTRHSSMAKSDRLSSV